MTYVQHTGPHTAVGKSYTNGINPIGRDKNAVTQRLNICSRKTEFPAEFLAMHHRTLYHIRTSEKAGRLFNATIAEQTPYSRRAHLGHGAALEFIGGKDLYAAFFSKLAICLDRIGPVMAETVVEADHHSLHTVITGKHSHKLSGRHHAQIFIEIK